MSLKPWSPESICAYEYEGQHGATKDLISVCVTVFNYGRYLKTCLDSIAAQTHSQIELLIVDDKSDKDDSLDVAVQWAKKNRARFRRIRVLSHVRNQGPAEARNTAFAQARGEYVFIIDADNQIYPRAIARLYAAAQEGGFDATYSQLEFFGEERRIGPADIWDPTAMRKENYVDVMALVARAAWEKIQGFSHIEEGWEDYDFWLKFSEAGLGPAYVPEILCRYRVHEQSRTYTEAHAAHDQLKLIMAFRHPAPSAR
jgi:glycosyltransferase involved in cell wall biosynthesis